MWNTGRTKEIQTNEHSNIRYKLRKIDYHIKWKSIFVISKGHEEEARMFSHLAQSVFSL